MSNYGVFTQICVLQVLNAKEANLVKKRREKLAKAEISRHKFRMSRHNFKVTNRVMSQQGMICRDKDKLSSSWK